MSLPDRLSNDLKEAMKAKDQLRMDVIRMIKAAILNKEIELKKNLDDAEMSKVMTNMLKQRRESIEQYQKAKRDDLAAKEIKEIAIIEGYLPKAASPEAIAEAVDAAIKEIGASTMKDMGNLMKAVMAKLAGQTVDGKHVSDLVKSRLSKV
ncbi:MAG: glutamyl-tRNA amidotransferase [Nitrospirae bacterium RIFCSPLOWO2_02_FULL_62_14]|nr:MAG: glutamyl-tRNA amidotransferase [Nitrospirae bacterium RIFCSPLOWO2_02_FULL_62_14]OGW69166.1 MAG: glutamyl-tRNA amidotransferase [Nitrospirae bacterium RIFCSPLOWO2_01_FULL_62_17]